MTEPIKSATWLFRLAIEWYKDHPGQQIPLEMWDQQVLVSKNNGEMKVIYFDRQAVKKFDYNMIPALAAIAMRAPPAQLLEIIKHHKITVDEANYLSFPWCLEGTVPSEPGDDQLLSPGSWSVTKAFVDAMSLDDNLTGKLEEHWLRFQDGDEFEVACLLSNKERLWSKTQMSEHFHLRQTGQADEGAPCPRLISADTLKDVKVKFDELSDEKVLAILDRSGNLLLDVEAENGFAPIETVGFFSKLFCDEENRGNYNRIIQAMNRVEDPALIETIANRMLAAIPDLENPDNGRGIQLLESIRRELDQSIYGNVLDNMVLKLCVLPIYYLSNVKNEQYEQTKSPAEREFCESGNRIFKLLNKELEGLAPSAWRKRHFDAIGKLISEWNVPQDLTDVDLQQLLVLTLSALETYKATDHMDFLSAKIDWYAEEAEGHVKKLIQFVSKTIDIDYDRFADLPSASKALLASSGLDLRKLPGINNQDKGALLSEGLGL